MTSRRNQAVTVLMNIVLVTSMFAGFVTITGPVAAASPSTGAFTEGSGETVYVDQSVTMDNVDSTKTITEARIILENPHKGDSISVDTSVNGNVDLKSSASNTTDEIGDKRMVIELEASGTDAAVNDFESVFQTTTFTNSESDTALDERRVRFSLGPELPMDETGHYYEHRTNDKSWSNAESAGHVYPNQAGSLSRTGYLATVRSQDEHDWIDSITGANDAWLAGSDDSGGDQSEGQWEWEDGPEDEVRFWTESSGLLFGFENWATGEPNDDGGEDHLELQADGSWNDNVGTTTMDYVYEYGDQAIGSDLNTVSTVKIADPNAGGASFPLAEDFNSNQEPSNWFVGGDATWGEPHNGSASDQTLQLTTNANDQAGFALLDDGFSSSEGILVEYDYYAAGGDGADGHSFFLVNGTVTDSSNINTSSGGSALGYAQREDPSDLDGVTSNNANTQAFISDPGEQGVPNGYLGVGFDEYGGFSNAKEGKDGGPGDSPEHVAIRGAGDLGEYQSGYPFETNADTTTYGGIDGNSDGTDGWRKVRVLVDPSATGGTDLTVEMNWMDGNGWRTVVDSHTYSNDPPNTLKLGFAGSTGGSTNYHAIEDLSISKPIDLQSSIVSAPSNDPYHAGETVEYSFDVTNNGPNDDSAITLDPTVTEGVSGLENLEWDTDNDDDFGDDTGSSTTISLTSGNTQTVQLRGTVGNDATGNLDHEITVTPSPGYSDTDTTNNDKSVSVNLNAAPSFASDEDLANINEDPSTNGGSQIDSNELFGDEFSDADGDSFAGIVATDDAADSSTEGTWQYSTDGGSNWYDIDDGSLSASNGLLLDSTTDLRFDPVQDYNGIPGKLTVFAVDDSKSTPFTSGATRESYDTTSDGKSSIAAETSNTVGITVDPVNDAPVASASSNTTSLTVNNGVAFDGTGSTDVDGDGLSFDWDVDGDGTGEYTGAQPEHTYTETGDFTVTLTVNDGNGGTDTDTLTVNVGGGGGSEPPESQDEEPPTADAGENVTVEPFEKFTLDGSNSTDDMGIDEYRWDFTSDGTVDTWQATKETFFRDPGTYTATLTVEDGAGKTDTDTVTIFVRGDGQAPTADAGDAAADEGAVAYASASGGERNEIRVTDGSTVTVAFDDTSRALGPALEDLTGDGSVDLPYVVFSGSNAGNLQTIDAEGETTTLVAQGNNADGTDPAQSQTILGVGRWQDSPLSVFYVNKSKVGIYRVTPGESPEEVAAPADGARAVLGTADIDGNDGRELVFLDSSRTVRYLDGDGNVNSTGVTVGSNNGLGAGAPADFDGDGVARVPVVTDSSNLALVGPDGATTLTNRGPAEQAPVAASDLDGDGDYELAFVTGPPDNGIGYVDDVGGSNTVTETDGDAEAFDRAGVAASATSQTADKEVETGETVEFDASNSSAVEGEIASYEWDLGGDGTYEESSQSLTHNYSDPGTYTVRLRVTDGQGLTDTDTYTVVVERPQSEIDAGLAPMPTYHGNLANTGNYDAAGPRTEPDILWNRSTNAVFPNQPVVADGTLYVAPHNGGELQALDPETGEQQWAAMPGGTWGTTWSAPAVVNGTLYLGTNNRTFHALDADSGEELGYFDASTQIRSAPAVVDGTVYFGANEGTMYAVNATALRQGPLQGLDFDSDPPASGDERWAHTEWRDHAQVKSNPAVVNGVLYYGSHNGNVTALDAASGERVWQFQTPTEPGRRGSTRHAEVMSDPTVVDGTVYIGSDSLKQRTNGDGHVHALDAETGEEQWSHTLTGDVDSGQAYADGVVYAGSRGGDFVALDAEDGSVVWEHSGGDFYGAPVVADGVVYVNDFGQDQVKAFDAESGDQLWAFDSPKGWLYGTPLVHDGKLYYGGNDEFYALGQPTISVSLVNVTNPGNQTIDVAFETTKPAESIDASVSGAESATLEGPDFEETETDAGTYRYTATYEGSNYGTYNVSVEVTSDDEETASGEDGVVVREPLGVKTSGGKLSVEAGADPVVVDSDVVVNGGDDQTIEGAKVIVDDGFRDGDTLSYDEGTADGTDISASYNDENGILTFTGAATPDDYQAVLRSVTFASAEPEEPSTTDRAISFSLGARASYSAATGHYYEYVDESGLTWHEADEAATEKTYFGQQGYLVTVTSADENTFVSEKIDGKSWMGASDDASEGTWRWVTGPEGLEDGGEGRHFFDQTSSVDGDEYGGATPGGGETVDGGYANWAYQEPNHWGSGENYAHFFDDGEWNDYQVDNSRVQGYVVEYGGMPDDPEVDLSDTTEVTVTAEDSESPTADAGGNVSTKEGTAAVFDASDSTDNVGIANYTWDFGDGESASGEKTTHVYDEAGTYEATLTVTDEAGNTDTATVTVTVEEVTLVAKTGFEDETVSAGETVEFDATSSDSSEGIDSYAWDFGNDGETDSTRPVQSVEYGTAGTYENRLTVTDELGNTATTVTEVTVEDSTPPDADAGEQRRAVDEDERLTFDASGSTDNGDIARYAWDFTGDGQTDATGETVEYTFADPGIYHVTLTVTDGSGNTDTSVQTVEVADVTAPEADAGADVTVNQSEQGTLDASGSSDNVGIVQYGWDLTGDGDIDRTGETISGSYDRAGIYDVTLVVRDGANNTGTDTIRVRVRDSEPPDVDLQTTALTGETNQTITFDAGNSSDNVGITSYEWDFGDGTTETTQGGIGGGDTTIEHTYDEDGEYEVTLTAVDDAGNTATDTVNVTVLDTSTLTATIATDNGTNASSLRAGENVTFDASGSQSSSDIESYEWDLDGDGETDATGPTVTTSYDELGNHTAQVTITDPAGNTATTTQNVTVVDSTPPTATTASEQRTVAEDESVTFDATGSTDNGDIASYEWDVTGDGQTDATGAEPNYTFTDPGEYLVTLTVTDSEGNTDTTTMTVTVTDETAPQVVVDQPGDVPQNEAVTLDAGRSTDNGDIASYEWDVDGDGQADLSGETATTSFEDVGTEEVTVTVTDEAGNSQSQTVAIEVTDATPPIADAGSSLSALAGAAIEFDASNSTDNVAIASYEWDFGDGETATGETATHTYENDGRYTAELTATDEAGNEATDTVGVAVVDGSVLLADAGQSRIEAEQGESVEFDATGSDGEGGLAAYEWDFDGDGEFEGTGPTPTHEFTEAGTYTVTLRVTDDAGNTVTDTVTVEVADTTDPVAVLGTPSTTVAEDEPVAFYGSQSEDNTGIERYEWDFDGDGVTDSTSATPTYIFEDPGTYEVRLTVTDSGGNTDTTTRTILVTDETPPVVNIDGESETTAGQSVTLDASDSTDNVGITSYEWDFGDGETATGADVTHTYDSPGEYTVVVTARDAAGNDATDTVTVTVDERATLRADAGPSMTATPGEELTFDGTDSTASEGIASYRWTFDDGTADTKPVTRHSYVERDNYTVTLEITDTDGRTATDETTVRVRDEERPEADAGSDQTIVEGDKVRLYAGDSYDNRGITEYSWDMGDGNRITSGQPTIAYWYDEPGTYPVTLTVTDAAGNTDRDVTVIEVISEEEATGNESETVTVNVESNETTTEQADEVEGLRIRVSESAVDDSSSDASRPVSSQTVRVQNVTRGSHLSVGLSGESESGVNATGNILVDRLELTSDRSGDFGLGVDTTEINLEAVTAARESESDETAVGSDLNVSGIDRDTIDMTTEALSAESREFVNGTGARPAGFIDVDHDIANEDVSDVTHHFRVRKSYLNATGVGSDAVTLYRDETDRQNPLETELVAETEEFYHYEADSPGLSRFTIGTRTPVFEITDAHVVGGEVVAGEQFTVEATVTNVGSANGTYEALLIANGTVVTTDAVALETGESQTVRLNHTFTESGNQTLALGNLELSAVDVAPSDDGLGVLVYLLVGLTLVLLLLIVAWRRRRDDEKEEYPRHT